MNDERFIGTSLTEEEHRQFAIAAAERGTKPRALLRELARAFLTKQGKAHVFRASPKKPTRQRGSAARSQP